jgi:hypothetical protein
LSITYPQLTLFLCKGCVEAKISGMTFRGGLPVITADGTAFTVIVTVHVIHWESYANSTLGLTLCYPYRINFLELLVLLDVLSGNSSAF